MLRVFVMIYTYLQNSGNVLFHNTALIKLCILGSVGKTIQSAKTNSNR